MNNGYKLALEAAGGKIIDYESFGSWQGEWWAKVEYEGNVFWVSGSYGSCSYCDSFESEFGYEDGNCSDHLYTYNDSNKNCIECEKAKKEYDIRLKSFGKTYLDCGYNQEEAEKKASEHLDWDSEAQQMLDFIQKNKI
jgi:hypothetical protein